MKSNEKVDCVDGGDVSPVNATAPEQGGGMRGHLITWAASVLSACIVGAAWIYTHPRTDAMAVVDLNAVLTDEIAKLDREVKPDMPPQKKQELALKAAEMTKRVEAAVDQVAKECGCVVISAAAVAANGSANTRDVTWRVKELVSR